MRHLMLDLETWGTAPGSALRSIGAVEFDTDGGTGRTFYRNILTDSCSHVGLHIDPDTATWWEKQTREAQGLLHKDAKSLGSVIVDFNAWWKDAEFVWGNGASFDPVLWEAASRAAGYKVPWHHRSIRDLRTIVHLGDIDPRSIEFVGIPHYALDDCFHQIKVFHAAWQRLFVPLGKQLQKGSRG